MITRLSNEEMALFNTHPYVYYRSRPVKKLHRRKIIKDNNRFILFYPEKTSKTFVVTSEVYRKLCAMMGLAEVTPVDDFNLFLRGKKAPTVRFTNTVTKTPIKKKHPNSDSRFMHHYNNVYDVSGVCNDIINIISLLYEMNTQKIYLKRFIVEVDEIVFGFGNKISPPKIWLKYVDNNENFNKDLFFVKDREHGITNAIRILSNELFDAFNQMAIFNLLKETIREEL